ncbi:MAG TPA: Mur ligase family protein, partial [Lysobacter sp.]|nr:Mur ligase family protein [Lysobacter sp.]
MNLTRWLERIEHLHPKSIDMGLERVREVAGRLGLGRPARQVITVGGTNGKGSTVAFIEAIARAADWKVGAYTSPHLWAYNERIRIDGKPVDDAGIVAAFEAIEAARGDTPLTYFEYGTLAALWLFERAGLDLAILEVGLGGRLDATNLVGPDVAVITTVALDHQDYLGDNREAIGTEKAGIARGWKPLVLGDDDPPSSVLRHAYAIGASAVRIGCDFFIDRAASGDGSDDLDLDQDQDDVPPGRWRWREVGYRIDLPFPRLVAPVQLRNAAVAIAALRALETPPTDAAIVAGVAAADLPGRLQRFDCNGVGRDGVEIVVDVG